ncbi:MAG: hypothetical protein [Caudoviricetes sp.]|nr:MAG: hypothetical protein [Caudoviricetes sp.]
MTLSTDNAHHPMMVSKIRERTSAEICGLDVLKQRKTLTRHDLKLSIMEQKHSASAALQAIIYLINSHDAKRTGEKLEYVEWKL